ncbi:MAG TPA: AI-2E family transporter [Ktedonobacteraceae bacterium]
MDQANWQRRRDILLCIVCIGIIAWFAWNLLLGLFFHAILLLLLSMAVAFLITPGVDLLERNKIPRVFATILMYIIVLAGLSLLFSALAYSFIQQVFSFRDIVTRFFGALPDQFRYLDDFLVKRGIPQANIDDAISQVRGQLVGFAQAAAANVVNIAFIMTNALIDILLILVLSFYFTLDGKNIRNNLKSIVPEKHQKTVDVFEDALNRVVGNYIRGQLTLAAIIGILAGVGCYFLGLSGYAIIIAFLAFLFETIPMLGPTLATIPAVLISLLLPNPFPRTFFIILYFVIVQLIESNVLGPRIVGHAVGLHPIAAILCLIIGVQLIGPFGALIATPIVAAAWVVIVSLYNSARGKTADQMLEHSKRKPLVIRPPGGLLHRRKRANTKPVDHAAVDIHEIEAGDQKVTTPIVKGNPLSREHINLLRPVPDAPTTEDQNQEIEDQ